MDVDTLLSKVEDLSALAPSVVKLLALINRDDVDNDSVMEVVRTDLVLSAKLLALANSAYFAPPKPVESLNEAVLYLGYEQVHRVALAIGLGAVMNRKAAGYAMDEGEFWRHSLLTATAAELIAGTAKRSDAAIGYTAGLLHDIGKIVLNQVLDAKTQAAVARVIHERGQPGVVAEQNLLKTNHAEVGAALLKKWKLPDSIVEAVQCHHEPLNSEGSLATAVALADSIAHSAAKEPGDSLISNGSLLERLQFDRAKYEEIVGEVNAALGEVETIASF